MVRLNTLTVIAKRIIYGRSETRFVEGERANFAVGLNCTTQRTNLTGFVRWRIQFNCTGNVVVNGGPDG